MPKLKKLCVWISSDLLDALRKQSRLRMVSQREIIESALNKLFKLKTDEDFEALLARRLNRIDYRIERSEKNQEIIAEALSLYVKMWLSTNHDVPESQREKVAALGKERHQRFVSSLASRIIGGKGLIAEMEKPLAEPDELN